MSNNIIQISPLGFPWATQDPFIFCVHHRDEYPKANADMGPDASLAGRNIGQDFTVKDGWRMYHGSKVPGFPYHPHRGFETITVVKEGIVDHTDSMGAAGRFGAGDVQWMTAGKGVQHSEMFPLLNQEGDNPMELFQIWLNLPKASKFAEPHFRMIWNDTIPVVKADDGKVEIDVIAGVVDEVSAPKPTPDSWAAEASNDVAVLTIKMSANASYTLQAGPAGSNRTIYFYRGTGLRVEENEIPSYHSVQVKANEVVDLKTGQEDCYILVLQGKPINEPVVQHGPFVMNTAEEIQEAFAEYRRTQFGGWPWPEQEQTHDRNRERFALHADGKLEVRPI